MNLEVNKIYNKFNRIFNNEGRTRTTGKMA